MNQCIFHTLTACAALVLTATAGWAQDHGRISYSSDDALVLGLAEDDWSFAGINTLILEGDRVWADDSGAIELEFPGGYYVRLADGSEVEVQTMPPDGLIRGWVGSFYVQRLDTSAGTTTFDTGAARFTLDPGTVARFDVLTDGATTLSVSQGRVNVFTDNGQVMDIGRGYRTYIDPGLLPSPPERFNTGEDTFDVWNSTRVNYSADYTQPEPMRQTRSAAPIGARDLNNYGEWVYVNNTQYWRPVYVKQYVPYRHGYWSHVPRQGYVWVGHYPFDYVTSHYGFWHYDRHYGWLWSYEPVYAPARVVSIYYGDVLFWAPATRYGYPVYGSHFDFTLGGFNFSLAFTSFAYKRHVFHHHHDNHHYYAQPLHRHIIHGQPRNTQPHVWDHHQRRDLDYWQAVHRNTDIGTRSEDPARHVRGFTQSDRRGEARDVAANLQDRRGRTDVRSAIDRRTSPTTRTSNVAEQRVARARDIESIRDRGERVAPPTDRATDRTERTELTRTPTIDRDSERAVTIDRTPETRERVIGLDRTSRTVERTTRELGTRGEIRTLPVDRGLDARGDRTRTLGERGTDTRFDDRGRDRSTLPTDRGTDRTRVDTPTDRSPIRMDRGVTVDRTPDRTTRPVDRAPTLDRGSRPAMERSAREIERPRTTLDPSRGLDRSEIDRSRVSDRSTLNRGSSDARSRAQISQPDRTRSIEIGRSPTAPSVQRIERPSAPSRTPISRETSGINYRRPEPAPVTRSAPAPTRSSELSRGTLAPSRAPISPSMRGNAPTAPAPRSVAPPSAPSSRGSAGSTPTRSRAGSPTRSR